MTPDEVAELFSVDRRTVIKWAREGKLDHIKLSQKNLRFSEQQVREFIRRKTISKPRQVDNPRSLRLPSHPRNNAGGGKSTGDSAKALRKEMRSWQL